MAHGVEGARGVLSVGAAATLIETVPNASAPVSAAFDGHNLWVLYMGADPEHELGSPKLLTMHTSSSRAHVTSQALPDGNVGRHGALRCYGDGVAGVLIGSQPVVFAVDARGKYRSVELDAELAGYGGSIAIFDGRALASFDENGTGIHYTIVDLASMRPRPMRAIRGPVQGSIATAAFGGSIAFSDFARGSGVVRLVTAEGGEPPGSLGLTVGAGALHAAAGSADRMYVACGERVLTSGPFPAWRVNLSTLTGSPDHGIPIKLGITGFPPEAAVAAIDAGALVAFVDDRGALWAAAVSDRGSLLEPPVMVTPDGERVQSVALAAASDTAYVLWVQIGSRALRAARLDYALRTPAHLPEDVPFEIDFTQPLCEMASAGEDPIAIFQINKLNRKLLELLERHDFAAAIETGQQALALVVRTFGKTSKFTAVACNNLAPAFTGMGMGPRAEKLLQRALVINKRVYGPRHPELAVTIGCLGTLYREMGQHAKAIDCGRQALEIFEAALDASHPHVAIALNNLSMAHYFADDFLAAEPLLARSIAITRTLGNSAELAKSLKNLGDIQVRRGDARAAGKSYREARELFEATLGAEHPLVAAALVGIAEVLWAETSLLPFPEKRVASYEATHEMLSRSRESFEKAYGPDHSAVFMVDKRLARLSAYMGRQKAAGEILESIAARLYRMRGPTNHETLDALTDLASHYARVGDIDDSEKLYCDVIARSEEEFGPRSRLVTTALHKLSMVLLGSGRISDAIACASRANKLEDVLLEQVLHSASERGRRAFLSSTNSRLHTLLSLHIDHARRDPEALQLAFDALIRRKGRTLEAAASIVQQLRASLSPTVRRRLDRHRDLTRKIASLAVTNSPLNADLAELAAVEQEIVAESAAFRRPVEPPSLDVLAGALGPDDALVEYVLSIPLRDAGRGTTIEELWDLTRARYVAYVVHGRGELGFVELGAAEIIDDLVLRFRSAIAARSPVEARLARQLHAELIQPVDALVEGCSTLHLSPDGALHLVPFAALRGPGDDLLIDRYQLNHVDSGRDLARFGAAERPRQESVVIAAPVFGDAPDAAFPALPGTSREAEIVATILRGARVLTGKGAAKSALEAVHGPRVLHLATHAYFQPNERPRRMLDHEDAITRAQLRSGLALAGANHDRTLCMTAQEIASMDLVGTRLVVLSACETGVGNIEEGDGIYGLRRAIAIAGAQSQLVSLWRIDDDATAELMTDYYRALAAGAPRNVALRSAQLAMRARSDRAASKYWAAFIAVGDPAPLTFDESLAELSDQSSGKYDDS